MSRCEARIKGEQCPQPARSGTDYCRNHAAPVGMLEQVSIPLDRAQAVWDAQETVRVLQREMQRVTGLLEEKFISPPWRIRVRARLARWFRT